jgi:DNA-binding NarL/FixJ family response regulator
VTDTAMSKVLLVDDHPVVLKGVRQLLASAGDLEVVAETTSGQQAVALASEMQPDLVVLDVRLGDSLGPDICRELLRRSPLAKVIILTAFDDTHLLRACLEAGACGVLLKGTLELDLIQALRDVRDGGVVIDEGMARTLETAGHLLRDEVGTVYEAPRPREYEVLRLMAQGLTTHEIADRLQLATNTVRSYTQSLMMKLHAHTRVQAIVAARRLHLI